VNSTTRFFRTGFESKKGQDYARSDDGILFIADDVDAAPHTRIPLTSPLPVDPFHQIFLIKPFGKLYFNPFQNPMYVMSRSLSDYFSIQLIVTEALSSNFNIDRLPFLSYLFLV
jgi:hypothetical protein